MENSETNFCIKASLKNNFCLSSCSPNTYPWAVDNNRRINSMQVCEPFCADFLATCGDEQICYNPEGLVEYLTDVIMGTVDNNKGYEIFECNTNSTCLAVRDTPIANGFVMGIKFIFFVDFVDVKVFESRI